MYCFSLRTKFLTFFSRVNKWICQHRTHCWIRLRRQFTTWQHLKSYNSLVMTHYQVHSFFKWPKVQWTLVRDELCFSAIQGHKLAVYKIVQLLPDLLKGPLSQNHSLITWLIEQCQQFIRHLLRYCKLYICWKIIVHIHSLSIFPLRKKEANIYRALLLSFTNTKLIPLKQI